MTRIARSELVNRSPAMGGRRRTHKLSLLALAALLLAAAAPTAAGIGAPSALEGVTVDEHPGASVPLDATFLDDSGTRVQLGHFFDGRTPVLLVLGYYRCPMLCSLVVTGSAAALAEAGRTPGDGFDVVAVSIDPRDRPGDAEARRREIARVAGADAAEAWTFLTGSEETVGRLADAVGFRYRFDPDTGQYAHPAVVIAVAPDGRVSGYVHGVRPEAASLASAIDSAAAFAAGKSLGDVVAACFHYTPSLRKWSGVVQAGLKIGGLSILAAVGALFGWLHLRRVRREAPPIADSAEGGEGTA